MAGRALTSQGIDNIEAANMALVNIAAKGADHKAEYEFTRDLFKTPEFWQEEYKICAEQKRPHIQVVQELAQNKWLKSAANPAQMPAPPKELAK
jgi:hypothetical protein